MSLPALRRTLLCALLAAVLLAPSTLAEPPSKATRPFRPQPLSHLGPFSWSHLVYLWNAIGCQLDPLGNCGSQHGLDPAASLEPQSADGEGACRDLFQTSL
jgi:hypothetical protein